MTKRPDDETPEPSGGRAAERLREFIDARFPEGERPELPGDVTSDEGIADRQAPVDDTTADDAAPDDPAMDDIEPDRVPTDPDTAPPAESVETDDSGVP